MLNTSFKFFVTKVIDYFISYTIVLQFLSVVLRNTTSNTNNNKNVYNEIIKVLTIHFSDLFPQKNYL